MLTFILIGAGLIVVLAVVLIAYGANQRKRAGQSSGAVVEAQQHGEGRPSVQRPNGIN